ncbi:hypothetical protein NYA28ABAC_01236 [Salinicola sp. NYA28a]
MKPGCLLGLCRQTNWRSLALTNLFFCNLDNRGLLSLTKGLSGSE